MKTCLLMITAILAMDFGEIAKVAAQTPYTGVGTSGMFGYRVIGGPSLGVSTPSMFGPRFIGPIQNSISLGIQNRAGANFSPPAPVPYSSSFLPPIRVTQTAPEGNVNDRNNVNNIQEQPLLPEVGPQAYPEPNMPIGPEGMMPLEQGPAAVPSGLETPGAASPAAMSTPYPRGWTFAASSMTGRAPLNARSMELSDRLTRIARDKGMLAGRRINVSLVGDTTIVEGAVRTPGDRAALANVLSLEPRVQRIDNRLHAEERNTAKSGNLGNR
jgi:hypothetical protein